MSSSTMATTAGLHLLLRLGLTGVSVRSLLKFCLGNDEMADRRSYSAARSHPTHALPSDESRWDSLIKTHNMFLSSCLSADGKDTKLPGWKERKLLKNRLTAGCYFIIKLNSSVGLYTERPSTSTV